MSTNSKIIHQLRSEIEALQAKIARYEETGSSESSLTKIPEADSKSSVNSMPKNAFEKAHDQLRYIIEHANSSVAVFDTNLNFIYVSQRFLDDYKVKEKNVIGQHHYDIFPDLPEKWRKVHQLALKGETSTGDRDEYPRTDGTIDYTRWECRPWYEASGDIGGIIVYTEIITDQIKTQQTLIENERMVTALLDNLPGVAYRCLNDTSYTMKFLSSGCKNLTGYLPEDFIDNRMLPYSSIIHPDDQKQVHEQIQKAISLNTNFVLEYRIRHKSGNEIWVWEQGRSANSLEKDQMYLEGFITDISDRKLNELKLQTTQFGIDHAKIGIYQVEEDGTILYANQYAADSLGYSNEEMKGKSLFEIAPDFNPESFKKHRQFTRQRGSNTIVSYHKRKDGSTFPVEVTINYFNFRGKVQSFSFVTDISERVASDQALKESENRFRMLAESAPVGILISDQKENTIYTNRRFTEMLGYTQKDIPGGKEWWPLAYPELQYREQMKIKWYKMIATARKASKKVDPLEGRVQCKDGVQLDIEFRLASAGELNFVMFSDISERKKTEQEILELKNNLEKIVSRQTAELKERISDLERFRQATIDREFRIKELKDEINLLKKKRDDH